MKKKEFLNKIADELFKEILKESKAKNTKDVTKAIYTLIHPSRAK